jgi:riboflavin kinase/FMN adenylyltransferase
MQTYLGFPTQPLARPAFLTIGNFDGVHRGHQLLVSEMVVAAHAAGCQAGLLTFDPHPLAVLRPDIALSYLTAPEERAELLAALGLDFVLILPFDRATAALTAAEFMEQIVARVPLCALWIGPDFALGRGREGTAARLGELGQELGYNLRVTPVYDWHSEPVRSSRIRSLLAGEGAVEQAAELLGRPYEVWGEVVHGAERGRGLGFPTANLKLPAGRLVPAFGIYACWAWRGETGFPAAVNVGVRPSFDNGHPSVEAYLLDFDGDLYGETLGLSFIQRLRGEQRFTDIHALIAQMGRDVEVARRKLADPPDDTGRWTARIAGVEAGSSKLESAPFWTELDHTADWAIRVNGESQRQLFARTAAAMFALQGADPSQPIALARKVNMTAEDAPELLVSWLNRLLLGQELDGALYTRFEIHEISPVGLRGIAYGYPSAPAHTAIKAVTFYDLDVRETADGWTATVTFDV